MKGSVTCAALVGLILLAACTRPEPTEVLVFIDAHPLSAMRADRLVLRVWGGPPFEAAPEHEITIPLTEARADGGPPRTFPITVPLIPRDGDTTRRFVLEARLLDAAGDTVNWTRVEGGYVPNTPREVLLCLEDPCLALSCDASDACLTDPDVPCETCRSGACASAEVTFASRGDAPRRCPAPPACVPEMDPETDCANGTDDDCDFLPDCADPDCDGLACHADGRTCGGEAGAACFNGVDDDCDDIADCDDVDCVASGGTGPEDTAERCADGIDNDCSGAADECDPGCAAFTPAEEGRALCFDEIDNDCDGATDCAEESCRAIAEICGNGVNDDCDSQIDNCDSECRVPEASAAACNDGFDNDCDANCDCADSECAPFRDEIGAACFDGRDNDCDGLVDGADVASCHGAQCDPADPHRRWCLVDSFVQLTCTNTWNDENHCGGCGIVCTRRGTVAGPGCVDGRCACRINSAGTTQGCATGTADYQCSRSEDGVCRCQREYACRGYIPGGRPPADFECNPGDGRCRYRPLPERSWIPRSITCPAF